mgnify:CR=1 FL=1
MSMLGLLLLLFVFYLFLLLWMCDFYASIVVFEVFYFWFLRQ